MDMATGIDDFHDTEEVEQLMALVVQRGLAESTDEQIKAECVRRKMEMDPWFDAASSDELLAELERRGALGAVHSGKHLAQRYESLDRDQRERFRGATKMAYVASVEKADAALVSRLQTECSAWQRGAQLAEQNRAEWQRRAERAEASASIHRAAKGTAERSRKEADRTLEAVVDTLTPEQARQALKAIEEHGAGGIFHQTVVTMPDRELTPEEQDMLMNGGMRRIVVSREDLGAPSSYGAALKVPCDCGCAKGATPSHADQCAQKKAVQATTKRNTHDEQERGPSVVAALPPRTSEPLAHLDEDLLCGDAE